jgi:hypothetical protein
MGTRHTKHWKGCRHERSKWWLHAVVVTPVAVFLAHFRRNSYRWSFGRRQLGNSFPVVLYKLTNLNWVSLFHPPYWTKWRNVFHLVANSPVASCWPRLNTICVVAVDMLTAIPRPDCVARCFCHMAQKIFFRSKWPTQS